MPLIQISKANFYHNLNQLALKANSKERLAVVLKDNAYGHGLELIAKMASEYGIKDAVVASNSEAKRVKGYFKRVLILRDAPIVDKSLSYAISSIRDLKSIDKRVQIELKIDTGMHRNGICLADIPRAIEIIKQRELNLIGVMSHFRSADELSSEYYWQKRRFNAIRGLFIRKGFKDIRFHSHNSAGLLRSNSFDEDIARVGIAIYGYNTLPKAFNAPFLKPVMLLWANRVSTMRVIAGERVGYGGDFIAPRDMIISSYDLGYGDGWRRGDSKNPYTIPEGKKILGRVSMDFITLEGDKNRVCIMDSAQSVAKHFNTIAYEITTSLKEHIPREVIDDF